MNYGGAIIIPLIFGGDDYLGVGFEEFEMDGILLHRFFYKYALINKLPHNPGIHFIKSK